MSVIVKNIKKTFTLSKKQMKINKTTSKLKVAVNGVSFEAMKGEVFGLLGPNGAGKTTTLRCIATLIKQDEGQIFVNGIPTTDEINCKKHIGFLTNEIKIEEQMTPNYAIHYFGRFYNMTYEQIEKGQLEIVVAGTAEGFTMVEGGAQEVSEELMLGALEKAQEFITQMCHLQDELKKLAGKEKLPLAPLTVTLENKDAIEAEAMPLLEKACFEATKAMRHDSIAKVKADIAEKYAEQFAAELLMPSFYLKEKINEYKDYHLKAYFSP